MSWFKNLIKFAGAKDKIQKFKVDDPSLKLFLYKYEDTVPWNEKTIDENGQEVPMIQSADDIQEYIRVNLLESLHRKIDRKNKFSNYVPKADVKRELERYAKAVEGGGGEDAHIPDFPQMHEAVQRYRQDEKGAVDLIEKYVNDAKQQVFDGWWRYITEDNVVSKENPAFAYSILKPVIDSSPSKDKAAPTPLNAEAVGKVWEEINSSGATQMNVLKRYKKVAAELDKEGVQVVRSEGGNEWINIPSKQKDPANFDRNVDKLARYSTGNGWCTASGMARPYLSKGDFWLYLVNGRAAVAIRTEGNTVLEIRGRGNNLEKLKPYWQEVMTFLGETNLDYENNGQYQELRKIFLMNADLSDKNKRAEVIKLIKGDFKAIHQISQDNLNTYDDLSIAAAPKYEKYLEKLLRALESVPPEHGVYEKRYHQFTDEYSQVPPTVKQHFSGNLDAQIIEVHRKVLAAHPPEFSEFPEEVKAQISYDEVYKAWHGYVMEDPYRYNDARMPNSNEMPVRQNMPIEDIAASWENMINFNIRHIDNLPDEVLTILQQKNPNFIRDKIVEDFTTYPFSRNAKEGYDKLNKAKQYLSEGEIINVYIANLQQNPHLFDAIPSAYKTQIMLAMEQQQVSFDPFVQEMMKRIQADPTSFMQLDQRMQESLLDAYPDQIAQLFLSFRKYYRNLDHFWRSIPLPVRFVMPDDVKQEVGQYYQDYVTQNPAFMEMVPHDMKFYLWGMAGPTNTAFNWFERVKVG